MKQEQVSTYARLMIDQLLSVHALACMARASDNKEHMRGVSQWVTQLESALKSLKREMEEVLK